MEAGRSCPCRPGKLEWRRKAPCRSASEPAEVAHTHVMAGQRRQQTAAAGGASRPASPRLPHFQLEATSPPPPRPLPLPPPPLSKSPGLSLPLSPEGKISGPAPSRGLRPEDCDRHGSMNTAAVWRHRNRNCHVLRKFLESDYASKCMSSSSGCTYASIPPSASSLGCAPEIQ